MKTLFVILLSLVSLTRPIHRLLPVDALTSRTEVLQLSKQYDRITVRQDAAACARLLADDYVSTLPEGYVLNKAQTLAQMRSGQVRFTRGQSDQVDVRVYGTTAVVTGHWTGQGTYQGKPFSDNQRYTTVFVRRNGRWQIIAEHVSEISTNN